MFKLHKNYLLPKGLGKNYQHKLYSCCLGLSRLCRCMHEVDYTIKDLIEIPSSI